MQTESRKVTTSNLRERMKKEPTELLPISVLEVYPLRDFQRRSGLQDWAYKAAKRKGLETARIGNRVFVSGEAWANYVKTQGSNGNGRGKE